MNLIHTLFKKELVKGLPKTKFVKDKICDACQLGKQHKSSFKSKKDITSSRPLDLLHLDLFGPNSVASLGGKLYLFVIVDDYTRFTWVFFLAHKSETPHVFAKFCRKFQNHHRSALWEQKDLTRQIQHAYILEQLNFSYYTRDKLYY